MGIKSLKQLIKKYAPEGVTDIKLKDLKGKRVCVDSSILIYKFRYIYSSDNFHIIGFLNKITEYLEYGIDPIFIFDGKPPAAKREILKKRKEIREKQQQKVEILKQNLEFINDTDSDNENNEVTLTEEIKKIEKNILIITKQHYLDVIELLGFLGMPYYNSYGEAEETCAFLQKNGLADYILTEDTDSLTFGGSNIIFSLKEKFTLYNLEIILNKFEMNQDEFIDLCILCGCDYTCTIPKIGPINAFNIIKTHRLIDTFLIFNKKYIVPDNFDYLTARNLFKQNNDFSILEKFCLIEPNINKLKILLSKNNFNSANLINLINFNYSKNKFLGEY